MIRPMTTRTLAALTIPALTVLLAGCASSPGSFAEAREINNRDESVAKIFPDDVVVGTLYDDRGIPRYQARVSDLTTEEIAEELRQMRLLDQELVRESRDFTPLPAGELARIAEIDRSHAKRLAEIVDCIGWPTRELVGAEAAQGAFVVVQHAGHDAAFQNRCLTLMVDQVEQGKLPAPYVALLTDRIRLFADQPQVFGTQMTFVTGADGVARCTPAVPIEDPSNLDARRDLMGLAPHDTFVAQLEEAYQNQHGGAFASVLVE